MMSICNTRQHGEYIRTTSLAGKWKPSSTAKVSFAVDHNEQILAFVHEIPRLYDDLLVKSEVFYQPKEYRRFRSDARLMRLYQQYRYDVALPVATTNESRWDEATTNADECPTSQRRPKYPLQQYLSGSCSPRNYDMMVTSWNKKNKDILVRQSLRRQRLKEANDHINSYFAARQRKL